MRLQILLSTMHQKDFSLLDKMRLQTDAVVVNQCDYENTNEFTYGEHQIKWINSKERGLSRSRNCAIRNASDDICLLSDDDLEYVDRYEEIILNTFKQYPDADIIAFQVEGIEEKFKDYYPNARYLNYLTGMKVSSVEIAFKLNSIKETVMFNERFGAGSKYIMGEENIFLFKCLKQGMKVLYVPVKIADLHIGSSTWFNGYNERYFNSKGAAFTCMSKLFSLPFIIQFAIRKYKLYHGEATRLQAIKYMLRGRKEFLSSQVARG